MFEDGAPAMVVDTGAGGDPGGGEGGSPGGEDTGGAAPPAGGEGGGEGGAGGEGGEPGAGGEGGEGGEPGGEPIPEENPYDGRKIDPQTRKQIADLRKAAPALAKMASDALFSRKAIMAEFPEAKSISDVINSVHELRGTLDAVGGQEGLTKLQETSAQYQAEIDAFAQGDPKFLADLYEGDAEGFGLSMGNALELLQERAGENGGLFDKVMAVPFANRLRQAGMHTVLGNIRQAIEKESVEDLVKNLEVMENWVKQVDGYADGLRKNKDVKTMDPRERALNEREAKIREAEQRGEKAKVTEFEGKVAVDVNNLNNSALKPFIEDGVKKAGLKEAGAKNLTDKVQSEIWNKMKADKIFQRDARALLKKGDQAASARFVAAKFKSLLQGTYQEVFNALYPNAGGRPSTGAQPGGSKTTPASGGGKGTPAPANKLGYKGGRPKFDWVDWGKTADEDWIRGQAVLTDGTRVKFDPNSPRNEF